MDKIKPAGVTDVRSFFADELKSVMRKQQVDAKKDSFEYLVDLLLRYMSSETFFVKNTDGKLEENVLAHLYADFLNGNTEIKHRALRRLGDICLVITGLFPDSLNRKLVDIDYYFGMGGNAYAHLSQLQLTTLARAVYNELSVKFKPFSDVLGEMSERSGLQSNSDLLRLYEKWLITGNERLKSMLATHGIQAPFKIDRTTKH